MIKNNLLLNQINRKTIKKVWLNTDENTFSIHNDSNHEPAAASPEVHKEQLAMTDKEGLPSKGKEAFANLVAHVQRNRVHACVGKGGPAPPALAIDDQVPERERDF